MVLGRNRTCPDWYMQMGEYKPGSLRETTEYGLIFIEQPWTIGPPWSVLRARRHPLLHQWSVGQPGECDVPRRRKTTLSDHSSTYTSSPTHFRACELR